MSAFDYSSTHPTTPKGIVPTNIEEGIDPYRLTSVTGPLVADEPFDGLIQIPDATASGADAYSVDPGNKTRVFKEAAGELVKANLVLMLLEEYIKRTRFLKMRRQPKEHYVRQQACMVGFLFHTRVKKQRLGYKDVRELFVNLFDLYDYCVKGIPKSAAIVLVRLTHKLLMIMSEVAIAIELKSNQRATNWSLIANICLRLGSEPTPDFRVKDIMPPTTLFTTKQILGQGGFGVVTKVVFGDLFELAVKMVPLDKQILPKYAVVDKVSSCMVNHPLVMSYFCTFRCSGAHVTVMEFVHAVDLLDIVSEYSKSQQIPLKVKQHVIAQLCLAVCHLHFKGFIHRDIKPSNVMITHGCRIKLFDFDTVKIGMGKFSNRPLHNFYSRTATEFLDRETAGTLYFFPPEVLLKRRYGRCIDWWALGVTLYEVAFGCLPFRTGERPLLKEMIKDGSYNFPKGIQLESSEVKFIERCLQKNPSRRLCSNDYNEFRTHEYLKETNWAQVEVSSAIDWTGINTLLKQHNEAKKQTKFQNSKMATMPYIEQTQNDLDSPALYTFTSPRFLRIMEKFRLLNELKSEDEPELILLDVVQKYRFKDYLM